MEFLNVACNGIEAAVPDTAFRLLFHQRPADATSAVVFIHGLNGHHRDSWGIEGQPGTFINRIGADLPHVTVAAFDYPSDLRRITTDPSLSLDVLSACWAQTLRQSLLAEYSTVAIIGHCLGGQLSTMALRHLLAGGDWPARSENTQREVVLFLLEAPHDLPTGDPGDWLAGLLGAMKFEAGALRANAAFWREKVLDQQSSPLCVQAYAVTSKLPSWVTPLQPHADLPDHHICRVAQSHSEMARAPQRGEFLPYDFVLARLRERLKN